MFGSGVHWWSAKEWVETDGGRDDEQLEPPAHT